MSFEERVYFDDAGREVHEFTNEFGEVTKITDYNAGDYIFMGGQWCPFCAVQMEDSDDGFVCPQCGHEISYEDAEEEGFPSYAAVLDYREENGLS